ncbi:precorrin-6A reductase [Oscillospiraceae bacterium WX1]
MKKLLIFGGTGDAPPLLRALAPYKLDITLCVATEYGRLTAPGNLSGLTVKTGRMNAAQIEELLRSGGYACVIDATHPYAFEVTKNIRAALSKTGVPGFRLLRAESTCAGAVIVKTMADAAAYLNETTDNVLLTTGSKELSAFTAVRDFEKRLYPRVLPTATSIEACLIAGFPAEHIIAMQGPFSKELNIALMRQFQIKTLVTKDGGTTGGFPEKQEAAAALGARLIVVSRPDDAGLSLEDVVFGVTTLLEGD